MCRDEMKKLLAEIEMPEAVCHTVLQIYDDAKTIDGTKTIDGAKTLDGAGQSTQMLNTDAATESVEKTGMVILTKQLIEAVHIREEYEKRGIPHSIYVDTMKCFTRFVNEHMASTGSYAFDRAFWTVRQTHMRLFRIGELEYELVREDEEWNTPSKIAVVYKDVEIHAPYISLHIPSDASLLPEKLCQSYQAMRDFFKKYYPEEIAFRDAPVYCESWLLSPSLCKLLGPSSHILGFEKGFTLLHWEKEVPDYLEWVYKYCAAQGEDFEKLAKEITPVKAYETLPEHTSLQRDMKQFLIEGGAVGVGIGQLKENELW